MASTISIDDRDPDPADLHIRAPLITLHIATLGRQLTPQDQPPNRCFQSIHSVKLPEGSSSNVQVNIISSKAMHMSAVTSMEA